MAAAHTIQRAGAPEARYSKKADRLTLGIGILLFALITARLGDFVPALRPFRPALLALAGSTVYLAMQFGRLGLKRVAQDRVFMLAVGYFLWLIFTIPLALWPSRALDGVQILTIGLCLTFAIGSIAPKVSNLEALKGAITLIVAVVGLLAVRSGAMEAGRLGTATMLDPNDLASVLATCLPFAVVAGTEGKSVTRTVVAWGTAMVMCVVLLQTGSRGGMAAMVVGIAVVLGRMKPQRTIVALAVSVALVPLAWSLTPPELRDRFAGMGSLGDDYNMTAAYGRIPTWTRGFGYFLEHPVTGVGYANFPIAEGRVLQANNETGRWLTAHNAFVQAFVELGSIGGLIFLAMLGAAGRRAHALWMKRHPEYLAALGAFLTAGMFLSHAFSYTLFALLGIMILASQALLPADRGGGPLRRRPRAYSNGAHASARTSRPVNHGTVSPSSATSRMNPTFRNQRESPS